MCKRLATPLFHESPLAESGFLAGRSHPSGLQVGTRSLVYCVLHYMDGVKIGA